MSLKEMIKVQGSEEVAMKKVTVELTFTIKDGEVENKDDTITWGELYEATKPAEIEEVVEEETQPELY